MLGAEFELLDNRKTFAHRLLHQVPDGMAADFYRQRLEPEATAAAFITDHSFDGFFIFIFAITRYPQAVAGRAGALFAVK